MPNLIGGLLSITIVVILNNPALGVSCGAGYYGTSSCTKCPAYQTVAGNSATGTTVITGCYISKNSTLSDTSGTYEFFASDCYYKQDSTGGGGNGTCSDRYTLRAKLLDILEQQTAQNIDEFDIRDDTDLKQLVYDLGLDSLDGVELIMEIEQVFDIEIPDDAYEKWATCGDMVDYILSKCS